MLCFFLIRSRQEPATGVLPVMASLFAFAKRRTKRQVDRRPEMTSRSLEGVAARIPGNALGLGSRVFPAVVWTNGVYGAEFLAVVAGF
jgi:hypothetical protein